MANDIKYAHVDDTASDSDQGYERPVKRQRRFISIFFSCLAGLITMGLIFAVYLSTTMHKTTHARTLPHIPDGSDPVTGLPLSWSHGDCGNSVEDAKARNCRYSIILHSWLPQSCLTEADHEDEKEMYKDRNWSYTSPSGQNLTMEEFGAGDYTYFLTSFDWHVTHCMYVWRRLHRILLDPTQELDSYTANYHHTNHCVKMIGGDSEGMHDSGTKVFVKYSKCAK